MAKQSSERPVNLNTAIQSKSGGYYIPADQLNVMVSGVMQILRNNFKSMMDDLKSGKTRTKPQNWYDKIRNFLWGYDNPNNPWYLANRLGDLGHTSPRNEGTLHEYKLFNSWIEKYNSLNITEARLVLDDMIRPHLEKIEDEIRDYIRNFVQPYYVYRPEFGPPKETQPAGVKGKGKDKEKVDTGIGEQPISGDKPKKSATSEPKVGQGDPFSQAAPISATSSEEEFSPSKPTSKGAGKKPVNPGKKSHPKTMAEKLKQDLAKKAAEQAAREAAQEAAKQASPGIGHGAYESVINYTPKHYFKDFDGCTLYERTLICLDKMRNIKED